MTLPIGTKAGPVWRCAPSGTVQVYFSGTHSSIFGDWVLVYGHGVKGTWAQRPMRVPMADLFLDREEAREEFRKRRAAQNAEHEAWRREQQATS